MLHPKLGGENLKFKITTLYKEIYMPNNIAISLLANILL